MREIICALLLFKERRQEEERENGKSIIFKKEEWEPEKFCSFFISADPIRSPRVCVEVACELTFDSSSSSFSAMLFDDATHRGLAKSLFTIFIIFSNPKHNTLQCADGAFCTAYDVDSIMMANMHVKCNVSVSHVILTKFVWLLFLNFLSRSRPSRSISCFICPVSSFGSWSSVIIVVNSVIADNRFSFRLLANLIAYWLSIHDVNDDDDDDDEERTQQRFGWGERKWKMNINYSHGDDKMNFNVSTLDICVFPFHSSFEVFLLEFHSFSLGFFGSLSCWLFGCVFSHTENEEKKVPIEWFSRFSTLLLAD